MLRNMDPTAKVLTLDGRVIELSAWTVEVCDWLAEYLV